MTVSASTFRQSHRAQPTDAESIMWYELRSRNLNGYKFVRQFSLGHYTVDFLCRRRKLVVELDGNQHADSASDEVRTRWLNRQGYSVLRFWNDEVLREKEAVLETMLLILEGRERELDGLRYSPADIPEHTR